MVGTENRAVEGREVDAVEPQQTLHRGTEVAREDGTAVRIAEAGAKLKAIRSSIVGGGRQVRGQIGHERRPGGPARLAVSDETVVENRERPPGVGLPREGRIEAIAPREICADDECAAAMTCWRRERSYPNRVSRSRERARAGPHVDHIGHLRRAAVDAEHLASGWTRHPDRPSR